MNKLLLLLLRLLLLLLFVWILHLMLLSFLTSVQISSKAVLFF